MKKIFVLVILLGLISCMNKFERNINNHFEKFIFINEKKDYTITNIETRPITNKNNLKEIETNYRIYETALQKAKVRLEDYKKKLLDTTKITANFPSKKSKELSTGKIVKGFHFLDNNYKTILVHREENNLEYKIRKNREQEDYQKTINTIKEFEPKYLKFKSEYENLT